MTIKKMVSALCIAAGLVLAVPAFSSTGIPGTPATIARAAEEVPNANGWGSDANGTYYLQNGVKLTGLQNIENATYYFDANGYRATGSVKIGKATYYFHPETGRLCVNATGLQQIGKGSGIYYYFLNKSGVVATNKWIKHKGGYFYANSTGLVKLGTIKVNGKLYHITTKGRMTKYGKSSYDKKYYNATKSGVLLTGLRKVNGKQYYFNKSTGARQTGLVKVGRSTFYFNTKDGTAKTGWVKVDGKYYYYLKNYTRASKWKTISKKRYYFNPANGCARQTSSWLKIGKYTYYFNSKGIVQTGIFKVGGRTYYASSTGARQTGWKTVSGRKYYFTPGSGEMKTGWFTYKNKRYYLTPSKSSKTYGAAISGWLKLGKDSYYFDPSGTMHTGWLQSGNVKYYFSTETGKMLTGKHTINGKTYDFGKNGKITVTVTGPWSVKVQRGNSSNGNQCFVVVYRGSTAVKAFACSTSRTDLIAAGRGTPTGTFSIKDKLYWHELMGPSWGQYCSHITSDILFHSVPNLRYRDPYSLETWEYNKLGSPASAGCIRLSVMHAKWLFDNVPIGTPVTISDHVTKPTGVVIEQPPKQSSSKSYDPTDTFKNPYSVR